MFPGGDHIDTREVRSYLNNLEVTLKHGRHDVRSTERPYSSLTWRSHDLTNIEKKSQKSRMQSGKSSSYGQISRPASQISRAGSQVSRSYGHGAGSRPVSGFMDSPQGTSKSGMSAFLPASERIMLETGKPRLLQRETVTRKLKLKHETSPQYSPREVSSANVDQNVDPENRRHIHVEIDGVSGTGDQGKGQGSEGGVLLDSYGQEVERSGVKFMSSDRQGHETPPQRLYRRFGSPQNGSGENAFAKSGEVVLRTSDSNFMQKRDISAHKKKRVGSARSMGSSMYTTYSGTSVASHKSNCDIPRGPFTVHLSNSRTTTVGPYSSVASLMGDTGPKDISKGIHHKSAWYHVPGRYSVSEKKLPSKRSQKRNEAKEIERTIAPTAPHPHATFMKSDYRKNNPNMLYKGYPGANGHTCSKGKTYTPYPRHDKKQYTICDQCRQEARSIMAAHEMMTNEQLMENETETGLVPTVSGLTYPDRPRQQGYVLEEPIIPDDYGFSPTVTFQDAVVYN